MDNVDWEKGRGAGVCAFWASGRSTGSLSSSSNPGDHWGGRRAEVVCWMAPAQQSKANQGGKG